jgi:hypothetical protein
MEDKQMLVGERFAGKRSFSVRCDLSTRWLAFDEIDTRSRAYMDDNGIVCNDSLDGSVELEGKNKLISGYLGL